MNRNKKSSNPFSHIHASLFLLGLLLLGTVFAVSTSLQEQDVRSKAQSAPRAGFVYREGTKLMLNGKQYQTASFNSFQLSGCGNANQVPSDAQIDALFASLPDNIMIRTWAFAGNQAKIDRVVKAAEKHNVKLMLTLADGRSHCGETDGASGPGDGKVPSWYTSGYKGKFMSHVTLMSTTYKDSPAIGMWEVINEPGDAQWQEIKSFLDAVAAEIKKNDPNHLISSGSWAEWAYGGEANFKSLHSGPNIDVGSLHEYDYDSSNGEIESNHFEETLRAMTQLNKVLIVGETGIEAGTGCKTSPQTRANAMKQKYDVYLNKGAGGVYAWNYAQAPDNCGHTFGPTDPIMEVIKTYPKNLEAAQPGAGGNTTPPVGGNNPSTGVPTLANPTAIPPTLITPTVYCVGGSATPPCATIVPSVSAAPTGMGGTTTPSTGPIGGVNPTGGATNPTPIVEPCPSESSNSIMHNNKKKKKFKKNNGGGFLEQFFKFLLRLIEWLISGGKLPPPTTTPNPGTNPSPTPCPDPSEAPTTAPQPTQGQPSAAPTGNVTPTMFGQPTTNPTSAPSAAPSTSQAPGGSNEPTASTCGGSANTPTAPVSGYKIAKCEDFNGTSIPSGWSAYNGGGGSTVVGGGRKASQCTVGNGLLVQTQLADGSTCGMSSNFGQKYGYWEVKMRAYSTGGGGSAPHPVLILWPDTDVWNDGELDYFESDIGDDHMGVFLHCVGNASKNCYSTTHKVDFSQWHVYGFEWTAQGFKGFVDGKEIYSTGGNGSNPSVSMHQTIQLDNLTGKTPVSPAKMEVDWVHMYSK
jgi:hypothetical protein